MVGKHPTALLTGPHCRKKGVHQRSCSCIHSSLIPNADLRKRPKCPRRLQLQAVFLLLERLGYRSVPPHPARPSLRCTNGCWQDSFPLSTLPAASPSKVSEPHPTNVPKITQCQGTLGAILFTLPVLSPKLTCPTLSSAH